MAEVNFPGIVLSFFGILVLISGSYVIYSGYFGPNYDAVYNEKVSTGEIINPISEFEYTSEEEIVEITSNLSKEEGIIFDKDIVEYILIQLGVYNLHSSIFSSDNPKIEVHIDENIFNAEIIDGEIHIKKGETGNEDIRLITTREEVVKMIFDKNYVLDSFGEGKSNLILVSSKSELFIKGYLDLYKEIYGE